LKNERGGLIMSQLQWFQERRLQIHAQVVVCPGINDGEHLTKTLLDLASFHQGDVPAVASAAVVPVGLTRFRPTTDELIPVSQAKAIAVIEQVQQLQARFNQQFGSTFAWLADEWFLIAGQDVPPESHYEDYPQIGNGVGSIRLFLKQFQSTAQEMLPQAIASPRRFTWVVGNAVEQAFQPLVAQLNEVEGLEINLVALNSQYWGQEITVTGLLTGQDLLAGLPTKDLGDGILLPSLMLKHDDTKFLDDLSLADVSSQLKVPIFPISGVEELINQCIAG
jgi:putative radical SAM enzyme (TIGR03279 family)